MTVGQMQSICGGLGKILMQPFKFNGIKITVNYAARAKHAKNWVIAPHYHPWFEFNYVSKGSLFTTINGAEFLIAAGDSYLIPPGVTHSHRHNLTGDDGICIRFSLAADGESRIIRALGAPQAAFSSGLERMNLSGGICSTQAEFAAWLMRIYEQHADDAPAEPIPGTFATQVIFYLEEYFGEKIMVQDIANAMNTSCRTLIRRFRAETGMSISDKLTEIRLDHATQLLISTKLPIYEIAAQCGYENEYYFSGIFKKKLHCPPGVYREKFRIRL